MPSLNEFYRIRLSKIEEIARVAKKESEQIKFLKKRIEDLEEKVDHLLLSKKGF